jgi:hypothetical protein
VSTFRTRHALVLALATTLGACAPVAGSRGALVTIAAAPPAPVESRSPTGPDALIWIASEDGKVSTRWLAASAPGYQQVAEAPELLIAAGAGVWRWSARTETLHTVSCAEFNGAPAGEGTGMRVAMERIGAPGRTEIVTPASETGANESVQTAAPVGSIGPYLFVRESSYQYSCGAHGFTGVTVSAWDVSRAEKVEILDADELAGARLAAKRLLFPPTEEHAEGEEDAAYAATLPHYGARGWLGVEHAFTAFACYACSEGGWSSYTRAVNVPARELPARLRPYARPPEVVTAYLGAHPEVKIAGWSELSREAAGALGGFLHPRS